MVKDDVVSKFFPASPRVMYGKAPLFEVICQLRFPRILKIESSVPADFQDELRHKFPLFERGNSAIQLGENAPIPAEIAQMLGQVGQVSYNFLSEDRVSTFNLSAEALSLTVKNYTRWEEFSEIFEAALSALEKIYRPSFYTRVGLRYRDLIDRAKLGLEQERWGALLNDSLIGELANSEFENVAKEARRMILLQSPGDPITVLLQHGLAPIPESTRVGYVIDFDFSCADKTEVNDVRATLNALHNSAGQAFRWCIKDRLHNALDPVAVK